ncbi:MAG: hypothetical protein L0I76_05830 [Pseudonocardia sp.]|nr:hypothetical protein [Pseudonocardia sp.]
MHHHRLAQAVHRSTHVRPVPQRSCGKRRYEDRIAADLSLALIRRHGRVRGKDPVRSYLCPSCDGWHLTSRRTWCASFPAPRRPLER